MPLPHGRPTALILKFMICWNNSGEIVDFLPILWLNRINFGGITVWLKTFSLKRGGIMLDWMDHNTGNHSSIQYGHILLVPYLILSQPFIHHSPFTIPFHLWIVHCETSFGFYLYSYFLCPTPGHMSEERATLLLLLVWEIFEIYNNTK